MNIKNIDLENKKVIVRCDFNVPIKDGIIKDDNRIVEALPTIKLLKEKKAKIILMSHLGRVESEEDKLTKTLKPVANRLSELLNENILFINETRGKKLEDAINNLQNGEILLMENTRFEDINGKKESKNNEELGKYWSSLADFYVNDAFGTAHRAHASNVGIASNLPSAFGLLIEKELENLKPAIDNPDRPLTVIVGGAKVTDKITVLENLVKIADHILIGGGMAYTFLKAKGYNIGASLLDEEKIDYCINLLKQTNKIILPLDSVTAKEINENSKVVIKGNDDFENDDIGLDIGPKTIELFKEYINKSKTIIWNGPVGYFEIPAFANATNELATIITATQAKTIVGGGDTAAALIKMGYKDKFTHISTGGGASLELLEGKELPGIKVIEVQNETNRC